MKKKLTVAKLLDKVPGKKYLGVYRFLPAFFALGATLEFCMIHWQVGQTNFYKVYKKREAEKRALDALRSDSSQMPAGVSWPVYFRFVTAAMVSMFAGSQTVHMIYRPLEDLDVLVESEKLRLSQIQNSSP